MRRVRRSTLLALAALLVGLPTTATEAAPHGRQGTPYAGLGITLLAPYGRWLPIVGTGVLFGLAHGLLIDLPVLVVFGIAVGWVRVRTSSVYPGMLLHGTFNGVALLASVLVAH